MGFFDGLKNIGKNLLGAVTGGLTGAVGSLFGLGSEYVSNQMSKEDQKELMKYQFDLNQSAVENQREYDKPINQMNRLAEAQLNPNLVYGSGSVVGNTSSTASASLGQARKTELSRYNQLAQQLQLERAAAEIRNINKDTEVKDSQIPLNQGREYDSWQSGAVKSQLYRWNEVTWSVRESTMQLQNAIAAGNVSYIGAMYDKLRQDISNSRQITESTLQTMAQARDYQIKQFDLDSQRVGELIRHNRQMESVGFANARALMVSALAAKMNAGTNAYDAQTRRKQYQLAEQRFNKMSDYEVGRLYQQTLNDIAYRRNYLNYLAPYYEQRISNLNTQQSGMQLNQLEQLEYTPYNAVQDLMNLIPNQYFNSGSIFGY